MKFFLGLKLCIASSAKARHVPCRNSPNKPSQWTKISEEGPFNMLNTIYAQLLFFMLNYYIKIFIYVPQFSTTFDRSLCTKKSSIRVSYVLSSNNRVYFSYKVYKTRTFNSSLKKVRVSSVRVLLSIKVYTFTKHDVYFLKNF